MIVTVKRPVGRPDLPVGLYMVIYLLDELIVFVTVVVTLRASKLKRSTVVYSSWSAGGNTSADAGPAGRPGTDEQYQQLIVDFWNRVWCYRIGIVGSPQGATPFWYLYR
jgi:hypothetical protein